MTTYTARLGCSYQFPRITFTVYSSAGEVITGALLGTVAVLEIGAAGAEAPSVTMRSDDDPGAPAFITWDDSAQTLDMKLSPDLVDEVGAGNWQAVAKIEKEDGDRLHDVATMTLSFSVVRWPVAVE